MPGRHGLWALGLILAATLLGHTDAVAAPAEFVRAASVAQYSDGAPAGSAFALRLPIPAGVNTAAAEDLANYRIYPIGDRVWPALRMAHVIGTASDAAGVKTVIVWGGFAPSTTYAIRFAYRGGTVSFAATTPRATVASGGSDLPLLTRLLTLNVDPLEQRDDSPASLHLLQGPDAERPGVRYRTSVHLPDPFGLSTRLPGGRTGSGLTFSANGTLGDGDSDAGPVTMGRAVLSFSHRHDFGSWGDGDEAPASLSSAARSGAAPAGMSFGAHVIPVGLEISEDMEKLVYRSRVELEGSASLLDGWSGVARSRSGGGGIDLHSVVGYTVRHLMMTPTSAQNPTSGVVDGQVSFAVPLGRALDLNSKLRAEYGTTRQAVDGSFEAGLQYAVDRNEAATVSLTYSNASWPEDFENPGAVRLGFRMNF